MSILIHDFILINNSFWTLNNFLNSSVLVNDFSVSSHILDFSLMINCDVVDIGFVFDVDVVNSRVMFFNHHLNTKLQLLNLMSVVYNSILVDNFLFVNWYFNSLGDFFNFDNWWTFDNSILVNNLILINNPFWIGSDMLDLSLVIDGDVVDGGFVFDVDVVNIRVMFFDHHLNAKLQLLNLMSVVNHSVLVNVFFHDFVLIDNPFGTFYMSILIHDFILINNFFFNPVLVNNLSVRSDSFNLFLVNGGNLVDGSFMFDIEVVDSRIVFFD